MKMLLVIDTLKVQEDQGGCVTSHDIHLGQDRLRPSYRSSRTSLTRSDSLFAPSSSRLTTLMQVFRADQPAGSGFLDRGWFLFEETEISLSFRARKLNSRNSFETRSLCIATCAPLHPQISLCTSVSSVDPFQVIRANSWLGVAASMWFITRVFNSVHTTQRLIALESLPFVRAICWIDVKHRREIFVLADGIEKPTSSCSSTGPVLLPFCVPNR